MYANYSSVNLSYCPHNMSRIIEEGPEGRPSKPVPTPILYLNNIPKI